MRAWLWRLITKVVAVPVRSVGTIGRGVALAVSVARYAVTDAVTMKLPFGDMLVQAWSLLKVTATRLC
ncbi:ABC transporter [Mycobacteroides abscessus]|nr:ABC transporter [Mycobacteroides abscessus]